MDVALASRQPISEVRALPAADLRILIDAIRERHDG
jgi:hypothetical protein